MLGNKGVDVFKIDFICLCILSIVVWFQEDATIFVSRMKALLHKVTSDFIGDEYARYTSELLEHISTSSTKVVERVKTAYRGHVGNGKSSIG
jgi:hypothetical protein